MVNKKKEGLSRLFEIAGQKKVCFCWQACYRLGARCVCSYLIGRSTGYSMNC